MLPIRVIVCSSYYFATKDALIGEVLHSIASSFVGQLDMLLGQHKRTAAMCYWPSCWRWAVRRSFMR